MTGEPTEAQAGPQAAPRCYRHPERETYIRCQRCERPICPDCMHEASVGFQCPDCVREGARQTRQGRTAYGGARPAAPGRITLGLIAANVVVFVLILLSGGGGSRLVDLFALLPESAWTVDASGAPYVVTGVVDGGWWQLVTSMFTHVQLWHIGFNMLALYILGPQLELLLGRWRFLALYLLSGLTGSAFVLWLSDPNSQTVGASGALFGLMAALLVVAYRVRGDVQSLLTLVAINVVITVIGAGYISWQGHLGGFVGGLALALVLVYSPKQRRSVWQMSGLAVVAVLLLAAFAARAVLG